MLSKVIGALGLVAGLIIQTIMDATVSGITGNSEHVTVENVLFTGYKGKKFNGIEFTDINFFELDSSKVNNNTILSFREAIAKWYYVLRLISAAILLVMLIYVGIKMALATIATEQARYKQMLTDWVTSIALLFLLHYIIIFIIGVNSSLVSGLGALVTSTAMVSEESDDGGGESKTVGQVLNENLEESMFNSGISGLLVAFIYIAVKGQALVYFVFYVKRMVTVGFLIIIAPLITITYAIDKMGDGKAQALNNWLKEICYNILIQPFHCVIYLAFYGAISDMIKENVSLGAYVLALVVLLFMKKAEMILRQIFHFEAQSMGSIGETGQNLMNARRQFQSMGQSAGKMVGTARRGLSAAGRGIASTGKKALSGANSTKEKAIERSRLKKEWENSSTNKSFRQYKKSEEGKEAARNVHEARVEELREKAEKKQEKKTDKARKIFDRKTGESGSYDKMIAQKAKNMDVSEAEMRRNYDNQAGHKKGDYDALKRRADSGDASAKRQMESNKRETQTKKVKVKENPNIIKDSMPRTAVRATIRGAKRLSRGEIFKNARINEGIKTGVKGSLKVMGALAGAAMAGGYTGEINDMYSGAQFGLGLMQGLTNTSGTIVNDTSKLAENFKKLSGNENVDMKKLFNIINQEKNLGDYDKIGDKLKDFMNEIKNLLGGGDDAEQKARQLAAEMQYRLEAGKDLDIGSLIKDLGITDSDDKKEATDKTEEMANLLIRSLIANQIETAKTTTGMDTDTFARRVESNVSNNYNYNYEYNVDAEDEDSFKDFYKNYEGSFGRTYNVEEFIKSKGDNGDYDDMDAKIRSYINNMKNVQGNTANAEANVNKLIAELNATVASGEKVDISKLVNNLDINDATDRQIAETQTINMAKSIYEAEIYSKM